MKQLSVLLILCRVTPKDLWKDNKTALLEVARETIGSVMSQKKKK